MADAEEPTASEVQRRLNRPFAQVKGQLEELFGQDWDEVEVFVETSSTKSGRNRADVIVDLITKAERRPGVQSRVRRKLIRWIGKPWRERSNPWERFKDRIPPVPPRPAERPSDLDEWTPLKPDEE